MTNIHKQKKTMAKFSHCFFYVVWIDFYFSIKATA